MLPLRRRPDAWPAFVLFSCPVTVVMGCASPGSPRPPSLHLPEPVANVQAVRSGNEVQLQFALPRRTTDGQSLAGVTLRGSLCRQDVASGPCKPVDAKGAKATLRVPETSPGEVTVLWTDSMPPELTGGLTRPIAYRITLRNSDGRSAGPSDPVYVAAGAAPAPVRHLTAEGTRAGVLLRWTIAPGAGEVLLERTQLDPAPHARTASAAAPASRGKRTRAVPTGRSVRAAETADAAVVWMRAGAEAADVGETIDHTVEEDVRYRYVAVRQIAAQVGGRILDLRSAPSDAVEVTWRDVFPPAAPQQLTALGYATGEDHAAYAVDLIWQPVNDPGVAGYVLTRQTLNASGEPEGTPQTLGAAPLRTPSFHDLTADPAKAYEYAVKAVDGKGNVSAAATARVHPQSR